MGVSNVARDVKGFVVVAFLLLGALFGMQIMNFIFVQLGPDATGLTIDDIGYNQSVEIQNNSLQGIVTYTEQSTTQFNTVSIAITLIILVAVFLVFWRIFVTGKKGKGESAGNFGE